MITTYKGKHQLKLKYQCHITSIALNVKLPRFDVSRDNTTMSVLTEFF